MNINTKMKSSTLFKKVFSIPFFLVISICSWGQATLPFTYDSGNPGISVIGLTQSGLGSDYLSSPQMKFDTAGDYLILNFSGVPGTLSYKIKWNQGTSAPRFPGDFTVLESSDGVTYSIIQLYNATNGTALLNAVTVTDIFTSLLPTTRYLKWIYTAKSNGNIGIGAIILTAGINPVLNLSTNSLNGFSYINGNGPSPEQNFTVSGNSLTGNIVFTPPTDYEISLGTGASFVATNPISLTQSNGNVFNTAIYSRLKSGLNVGTYNENITLSTNGANATLIACNGTVTANPTITLTDITDPTLNAEQGKPVTQILNVSGVNLNADLALSISGTDAGLFSLSQYSVNLSGSNVPNTPVTITYTPVSPGASTATLLIASTGAMPVIRILTGNASNITDLTTPNASLNITVENGSVLLTANAGETIGIFNSIGQLLIQKLAVDGINTIPVSTHGVLIVKVGAKVAKVIM